MYMYLYKCIFIFIFIFFVYMNFFCLNFAQFLVVPYSVPDAQLKLAAPFRGEKRLPVLTWKVKRRREKNVHTHADPCLREKKSENGKV